jgi:hypothetical protein
MQILNHIVRADFLEKIEALFYLNIAQAITQKWVLIQGSLLFIQPGSLKEKPMLALQKKG